MTVLSDAGLETERFTIVLQHFSAIGDKWISRRVRSSPGRWKNPRRELIKHLCRRTSGISGLIGLWCPWAYPAWTIRAYGQITVFVVSSQIQCSETVFLAIALLVFFPVQKGPLSSSLKYNGVRSSVATAHWNPQKFKVRITCAGPEAPGPR